MLCDGWRRNHPRFDGAGGKIPSSCSWCALRPAWLFGHLFSGELDLSMPKIFRGEYKIGQRSLLSFKQKSGRNSFGYE